MLNAKNKNKGQVLVLVALSLVVFLGFVALAIDVAYFYHTKNQLQGAADAAALAGASFLTCETDTGGPSVFLQTDARDQAKAYAYKNTAAGLPVEVASNYTQILDDNNDIQVGFWDGTSFSPSTGSSGLRINAMKVVDRRTGDDPVKRPKVATFFGRIFSVSEVGIRTEAIATGCNVRLSPIAVNEYWMGKETGPCGGPVDADSGNNKRTPYEVNHFYPNSFVRPAYGQPFGNVTTFSRIMDCNFSPPVPVTGASPNGPLTSPCSGADCKGRMTPTSGRVFAIVGGEASPNTTGQMYSLIDLDHRIGCSQGFGFGCDSDQQWYDFSAEPPLSVAFAQTNPSKDSVAANIRAGFYPHELPVSVHEVYQPLYATVTTYVKASPYATTAYFSGQGVTGQMVNENYYDNGNFQRGKYAPGNEIIVAVYDGIVGDNGNQARTTIVGFAKVKIFGYGNRLTVNPGLGGVSVSGPQNTMFGYVETLADSFKEIDSLEDWAKYPDFFKGHSTLVK